MFKQFPCKTIDVRTDECESTIDAAEPKRLKASALALGGYNLWHKLSDITSPVMVIAAKTDILHSASEIQTMVDLMPGGRLEIAEGIAGRRIWIRRVYPGRSA